MIARAGFSAHRTIDARYPGLRFRVVDEQDRIRRHMRIFVGQDETRTLAAPLRDGGELLIFGALIAITTSVFLIPSEIEKRTIYSVLSKPVQRWEFFLGKFLGGVFTGALLRYAQPLIDWMTRP